MGNEISSEQAWAYVLGGLAGGVAGGAGGGAGGAGISMLNRLPNRWGNPPLPMTMAALFQQAIP